MRLLCRIIGCKVKVIDARSIYLGKSPNSLIGRRGLVVLTECERCHARLQEMVVTEDE